MTRVAFIGSAGHSHFGIDGIKVDPEAQFVGAAPGSKAEELSPQFCEKFLDGPFYESVEELIETTHPDVVVVSPHFLHHASIASYCLLRGIHVYCEKPLAFNREDLKCVQAVIDQGKARLALMLNYRHHPAFCTAHAAITQGAIGEVLHISSQKSYRNGPKPAWQHLRKNFGGIIPWVGSHALDWILWVSQGKTIIQTVAMDTRLHNCGNGEMESSAYACFNFKGGGQAMASIDYLRPKGAPSHGDDRLRVAGSKGVIEVLFNKVTLMDAEGTRELPLLAQPQLFADFLAALRNDRPYSHSHEDIWRLTELCIAAQEAADTNSPVQRHI